MNFCTIISGDYQHRAIALSLSLKRCTRHASLTILALDGKLGEIENVKVIQLDELCKTNETADTIRRLYNDELDKLRWSLKPILLRHLIMSNRNTPFVYCDSDCCFFSEPSEIFTILEDASVVLTPHWRPIEPYVDTKNFRLNFLDGLYNAGCVGANGDSIPELTWWAAACASACEKAYEQGLYHDQRYLDLMPIYFPRVQILRHRGYNLADWNAHLRIPDSTGVRSVPDSYRVVMVHFTFNTIKRIERGGDPLLLPLLGEYRQLIEMAGSICSRPILA